MLSESAAHDLYWDVMRGTRPAEKLKARAGDCAVYRTAAPGIPSVIVKVWKRQGSRAFIRNLTRTSPMLRELRALQRVQSVGVTAPRVHAAIRPETRSADRRRPGTSPGWTEALILEDLGHCISAMDHVKALQSQAPRGDLDQFLDEVITLTRGLVECGILDQDHSFLNVVATPEGRAARLDFEIARLTRFVQLYPQRYGKMIGRLLVTYAFTVQPDSAMATEFASRLVAALHPGPRVLRHARTYVDVMLEKQRRHDGIDLRLALPW
jgi:hypothetical protein